MPLFLYKQTTTQRFQSIHLTLDYQSEMLNLKQNFSKEI